MDKAIRKIRNNKNRHRIIYHDKLDRRFSDRRITHILKLIRAQFIKSIGNNHNKNPESNYPD